MKNISIISSSVRVGRNSHRVALYFKNYLEEHQLANVSIIDLQAYDFPIFEERLKLITNPTEKMLAFAEEITEAEGINWSLPNTMADIQQV